MSAARDAKIATEEWLHAECAVKFEHTPLLAHVLQAGGGGKAIGCASYNSNAFFGHFGNKTCSLLELYKCCVSAF